jgi:cobalt-zinc-cadmium resistance protein CzcA
MKSIYSILVLSIAISLSMAQPVSPLQLSFDDALELAYHQNPSLLGSEQMILATRGKFWKALSPPSPTLTADYDYIPSSANINQFGERKITLSQSFEFPSTILLRGAALSSETEMVEREYAGIRNRLTSQVKNAYTTILGKRWKLQLAKESVQLSDNFTQKAKIRKEAGEASHLEFLTATAQHAQALNQLEIAQNELQIAESGLMDLLGIEIPSSRIVLTDSLRYTPFSLTLEHLSIMAQTSNPFIKQEEAKRTTASINRSIAWSSFLPSFTASYGKQTVNGSSDFYSVSIGLALPLWFMFDQRGQIQEAAASLRAAELHLQASHNAVQSTLRIAFFDLKNNERQAKLYSSSLLPQAEEVYRVAMRSYESGEISYVELLQASQTLNNIKAAYVDVLVNYNTSLSNLELAVGVTLSGEWNNR